MTEEKFLKEFKLIDWEINILKEKRKILIDIFCRTSGKFKEGDSAYWGNMPVFIRYPYVVYRNNVMYIYYSIGSFTESEKQIKDSFLGNVPESQLSKHKNS